MNLQEHTAHKDVIQAQGERKNLDNWEYDAKLTLNGEVLDTAYGLNRITEWLRRLADDMESNLDNGERYAKSFRASIKL